jgi:hypothetical protein
MRRQAFDGERTSDADARLVLLGTIKQEFNVGAPGDRDINAPLALNAGCPPCSMGIDDVG